MTKTTAIHELMSIDTRTLETVVQSIRSACALETASDKAELLVDLSLKLRGGSSRSVMAVDKSESAQAHGKACRAIYIHISELAGPESLISKLMVEVPKAVYAGTTVRKHSNVTIKAYKKLGFEVKGSPSTKVTVKSTDATDELVATLSAGITFVCRPLAEKAQQKLANKELKAMGKESKDSKQDKDATPSPTPVKDSKSDKSDKTVKKPSINDVYKVLAASIASGKVTMQEVTNGIQAALDAIIAAEAEAKAAEKKDIDKAA